MGAAESQLRSGEWKAGFCPWSPRCLGRSDNLGSGCQGFSSGWERSEGRETLRRSECIRGRGWRSTQMCGAQRSWCKKGRRKKREEVLASVLHLCSLWTSPTWWVRTPLSPADLPRAVAANELRSEKAQPPIFLALRFLFPTDTDRELLDHLAMINIRAWWCSPSSRRFFSSSIEDGQFWAPVSLLVYRFQHCALPVWSHRNYFLTVLISRANRQAASSPLPWHPHTLNLAPLMGRHSGEYPFVPLLIFPSPHMKICQARETAVR